MKCYACDHDGDDVMPHKVGDELLCLCFGCWDKVARGGREPLQVLEAIVILHRIRMANVEIGEILAETLSG